MRNRIKKGIKIPKGTEQETGLTRGKTIKKPVPVRPDNPNESRVIPAGTQQETGLTRGQTEKPGLQKRNKK
jgi:hypothetical protein